MGIRQPGMSVRLVPGGGPTMFTRRALMTPLLEWMTSRIAGNAAISQAQEARRAQKAAPRRRPS